jgi:hypothetical protein
MNNNSTASFVASLAKRIASCQAAMTTKEYSEASSRLLCLAMNTTPARASKVRREVAKLDAARFA